MWQALVEEGSILNIHLGSSGQLAVTAPDAPMDVMITLQPMNICMAAADLVWSRVFKNYPELKVALSEGGTGWIPYFLDRLDRTFDMHHAWTGADFGEGVMPSDVFREHILTCFITDPIGLALRDVIGIDNICWEQDYPHSDSSWPTAPDELATMATKYGVSDAELDKMTHENAMRWYHFDPFASIPREQCTVGALRASVAGHDVSVHSMDQGRHAGAGAMSLGQLAAAATADSVVPGPALPSTALPGPRPPAAQRLASLSADVPAAPHSASPAVLSDGAAATSEPDCCRRRSTPRQLVAIYNADVPYRYLLPPKEQERRRAVPQSPCGDEPSEASELLARSERPRAQVPWLAANERVVRAA